MPDPAPAPATARGVVDDVVGWRGGLEDEVVDGWEGLCKALMESKEVWTKGLIGLECACVRTWAQLGSVFPLLFRPENPSTVDVDVDVDAGEAELVVVGRSREGTRIVLFGGVGGSGCVWGIDAEGVEDEAGADGVVCMV